MSPEKTPLAGRPYARFALLIALVHLFVFAYTRIDGDPPPVFLYVLSIGAAGWFAGLSRWPEVPAMALIAVSTLAVIGSVSAMLFVDIGDLSRMGVWGALTMILLFFVLASLSLSCALLIDRFVRR